jgi:signal transduction histidine kinase
MDAVREPLTSAGEDLGVLEVAAPRHGFTPAGRTLVATLAAQVAAVVRATALNVALEEARRRLLSATRAERSRLRRDLHDGLGPSLSGIALGLDAMQDTLRRDPVRAEEILRRSRDEIASAVEDVRRILDGLRPPGLDALGLLEALRLHTSEPVSGLTVEVAADSQWTSRPDLDPDVEVAAYRIALEAVTNARRHAEAAHCAVRLSAYDDQLGIEISDDGHGFPVVPHEGVGLLSMRHRAESLGGTFQLRSDAGGTTVRARLPRQRS